MGPPRGKNQFTARRAFAPGVINLGLGAPGPEALHAAKAAMSKAVTTAFKEEAATDLFQYGPTAGDPDFIDALAAMLEQEYGVKKNIANMMSASGSSLSLGLISGILLARDAVVFLEVPTYYNGIKIIRDDLSFPVVLVDREDDCIDLEKLEKAIIEAKKGRGETSGHGKYWAMIYLIPNFHNPTGQCMPPAACRRVIELAKRHNILIYSDDVYDLLYYSGDRAPKRLQDYEIQWQGRPSREERDLYRDLVLYCIVILGLLESTLKA